ncbi:hypothetical protein DFH27DRAFT_529729 [Peziza echinospora]|nr:hypothetical protein DFH27DRAFT_529729 [Peziza echinospora]
MFRLILSALFCFHVLVCTAWEVEIDILQNPAKTRQMWGYRAITTLPTVPGREEMKALASEAAIKMRTLYTAEWSADDPMLDEMPFTMTAYSDGTTTVYMHSSIKNAPKPMTALKVARSMNPLIEAALKKCEGDDGRTHGNYANCAEVATLNMYLATTGKDKLPATGSLITTVEISKGKAPRIKAPCDSQGVPEKVFGCEQFLLKIGGIANACIITSKRDTLPGTPVNFKRATRPISRILRKRVKTTDTKKPVTATQKKAASEKLTPEESLDIWGTCAGKKKTTATSTKAKASGSKAVVPLVEEEVVEPVVAKKKTSAAAKKSKASGSKAVVPDVEEVEEPVVSKKKKTVKCKATQTLVDGKCQ